MTPLTQENDEVLLVDEDSLPIVMQAQWMPDMPTEIGDNLTSDFSQVIGVDALTGCEFTETFTSSEDVLNTSQEVQATLESDSGISQYMQVVLDGANEAIHTTLSLRDLSCLQYLLRPDQQYLTPNLWVHIKYYEWFAHDPKDTDLKYEVITISDVQLSLRRGVGGFAWWLWVQKFRRQIDWGMLPERTDLLKELRERSRDVCMPHLFAILKSFTTECGLVQPADESTP